MWCARTLVEGLSIDSKDGGKWRFRRKDNKKAMIAVWDDSETTDNKSDEEHHKMMKDLSMKALMRRTSQLFMNALKKS